MSTAMPETTTKPEIISDEEQDNILTTIRAISTSDGIMDFDRARMLLIGVYVALGSKTPAHWVINIQCHRVDRLFSR